MEKQLEKLKAENPWLKITSADDCILEEDKSFFEREFGSVEEFVRLTNSIAPNPELTFSCLPDPFFGNPNSKVYCLNKNPGMPDMCFKEEGKYINAAIDNLHLNAKDCFWAEKIRNKCGKEHNGVDWLRKRVKKLHNILNGNPDIFFIEYFPYHSTTGFPFPENLPSYDFSNKLIDYAIDANKIIIIMREKINWLRRIKRLAEYPRLYILKCPQGGYLTPGNIVRYENGKPLTEEEIKQDFKL